MPHYISKQGLQKLQDELETLKGTARKEVIARIAAAKELGDLKENAEYAEAKDDQAMLEARISAMESKLKDSLIIEDTIVNDNSFVSVGSTVIVECNGNRCAYTIVGSEEADPIQFRISNESPIGRAFLNRSRGERVNIKVPRGEFEYTIIDIS
ncbi:transcription elongation factor GreA [Candidatus Uhrbacteria bacterium]|nr:transcription elongation factor GreA [Candidatus Uhrbacteria bacterium]